VPPLVTPLPIMFLQCFGDKSFATALWMGAMIYTKRTLCLKNVPLRHSLSVVQFAMYQNMSSFRIFGDLEKYTFLETFGPTESEKNNDKNYFQAPYGRHLHFQNGDCFLPEIRIYLSFSFQKCIVFQISKNSEREYTRNWTTISSPKINRCSQFFHPHTLWRICNNSIDC